MYLYSWYKTDVEIYLDNGVDWHFSTMCLNLIFLVNQLVSIIYITENGMIYTIVPKWLWELDWLNFDYHIPSQIIAVLRPACGWVGPLLVSNVPLLDNSYEILSRWVSQYWPVTISSGLGTHTIVPWDLILVLQESMCDNTHFSPKNSDELCQQQYCCLVCASKSCKQQYWCLTRQLQATTPLASQRNIILCTES